MGVYICGLQPSSRHCVLFAATSCAGALHKQHGRLILTGSTPCIQATRECGVSFLQGHAPSSRSLHSSTAALSTCHSCAIAAACLHAMSLAAGPSEACGACRLVGLALRSHTNPLRRLNHPEILKRDFGGWLCVVLGARMVPGVAGICTDGRASTLPLGFCSC